MDHEQRRECNRLLHERLLKGGHDTTLPHEIDHFFYCETPNAAAALCDRLRAASHRVVIECSESEWDGQVQWLVQSVSVTILSADNLDAMTIECENLTQGISAEYDGWGTEIIAPENDG